MPEKKNIYYFHTEDSVWIVYPTPGENGKFTGIILEPNAVIKNKLKSIHIYAGPPSAIKIKNSILTCPMQNIGKVENFKISAGSIISSIGVILLLFALPAII